MKETTIGWTATQKPDGTWVPGNTFNCWIGCEHKIEEVDGKKIEDPACQGCYAEFLMDKRFGKVHWGPGGMRVRTSENYWKDPSKWDKQAARQGFPTKVFCASLADWLDDNVPIEWLADLMLLIRDTPNLIWMMLSKRPELWESRLKQASQELPDHPASEFISQWLKGNPPANVWAGATVTLQALVDIRVPALLDIPAKIRFLSLEPLADGNVDVSQYLNLIDMVIVGGESDTDKPARHFHLEWAEFSLGQCREHNVPFFMKQMGAHPFYKGEPVPITDKKGEILEEMPEHLRVREFPVYVHQIMQQV